MLAAVITGAYNAEAATSTAEASLYRMIISLYVEPDTLPGRRIILRSI